MSDYGSGLGLKFGHWNLVWSKLKLLDTFWLHSANALASGWLCGSGGFVGFSRPMEGHKEDRLHVKGIAGLSCSSFWGLYSNLKGRHEKGAYDCRVVANCIVKYLQG